MLQSCPNCDQQLLMVNGNWRHMHTQNVYECWTKFEVEAGVPYIAPPVLEEEEAALPDWASDAFAGLVTPIEVDEDVLEIDKVESDNSDLFALLAGV